MKRGLELLQTPFTTVSAIFASRDEFAQILGLEVAPSALPYAKSKQ